MIRTIPTPLVLGDSDAEQTCGGGAACGIVGNRSLVDVSAGPKGGA